MSIVAIIAVVLLFISVGRLQSRVSELEKSLKGSPQAQPRPTYYPSTPSPTAPQSNFGEALPVPAPTVSTGPSVGERFSKWLKEDWLMKLGALLFLIGFGWLASYAFINNWIGPMGRIALGIIAGALFLVLGYWRSRTYLHQGGVFLVVGSTTIILTLFAARTVYDFFTPLAVLAVMFLTSAFVAFVSVQYNNRALAMASLISAGIAPLLVNAPDTGEIMLFSYLFAVVLGALLVTALTGRRELTIASLLLITLYSLPYLGGATSTADLGVVLLFMYTFSALFFLSNTAGILKLKDKDIVPDLICAAGNGAFLLTWIMMAAQEEWKSLIISAWMVVFTVGAFLIFRITSRREPFYVYAGIGVAMLATATAAELQGSTLTIAYTVEAAVLALLTYVFVRNISTAENVSLLLIAPALMAAQSGASSAWSTGVFHKDFFVLLLMGLVLLGVGLFFNAKTRESGAKFSQINSGTLVLGSLFIYTLLWLSLHAGLHKPSLAVLIALFIYTVIGIAFYFNGMQRDRKGHRLYGALLIGFVVARLLLIDVWLMELSGRIIIFFIIGALLISTAFLSRKKKIINA